MRLQNYRIMPDSFFILAISYTEIINSVLKEV